MGLDATGLGDVRIDRDRAFSGRQRILIARDMLREE